MQQQRFITSSISRVALVFTAAILTSACSILPKGIADLDVGMKERGIASWYGDDFHGWVTASGEVYDMHGLTAAHRTLPLGTVVRVTNVVNGKHVVIRVNDRGPYINGRIMDLSYAAADRLGMVSDGVAAVHLEVVGQHGWLSLLAENLYYSVAARLPWTETTAQKPRNHRSISRDVLRERRVRRVADILAADRRVDGVATLSLS